MNGSKGPVKGLKKSPILILGALGAMRFFRSLKKPELESKAVLILGNGRSGTSVLTKGLNYMGVDIGEDKFIKATEVNPKGYFENETILNLHKKIGGKLRDRPSPNGYENSSKIRAYRKELTNYVRDTFLEKPVWAWKDPRTNDYMALWKAILKDLNVELHYVIIIRNPIDVVASNKRAWNRDEEWALRQWQLRTLFSIRDSFGGKRIIVSYEELFNHPLECLRRISQTLELPWPDDEENLQKQLDEFIDPNLQRSNSDLDLEEFKNREDITDDVKELYLLALEGVHSTDYFQTQAYHDRVEKLYQGYLQDYGKLKRDPPTKEKHPKEVKN